MTHRLLRTLRPSVLALLMTGVFAIAAQAATIDLNWQIGLTGNDATINVGDTVRWTWTDFLPHTVTSLDGGATFDSGTLSGLGQTFEFTFNSPGSFPYRCDIHPASMTGTITVNAPVPGPPAPALVLLAGAVLLMGVQGLRRHGGWEPNA